MCSFVLTGFWVQVIVDQCFLLNPLWVLPIWFLLMRYQNISNLQFSLFLYTSPIANLSIKRQGCFCWTCIWKHGLCTIMVQSTFSRTSEELYNQAELSYLLTGWHWVNCLITVCLSLSVNLGWILKIYLL